MGERIVRPARVAVAEPESYVPDAVEPLAGQRRAEAADTEATTRRLSTQDTTKGGARMSPADWASKDFYKMLGVSKDASADDIKKAYRKLARANHPDSNQGDAGAEERFKSISEAYSVLSDTEQAQGLRRAARLLLVRRLPSPPRWCGAVAASTTMFGGSAATSATCSVGCSAAVGTRDRPAPARPRRRVRDVADLRPGARGPDRLAAAHQRRRLRGLFRHRARPPAPCRGSAPPARARACRPPARAACSR